MGEHLRPDRAETLVAMLYSFSVHVLFTAAIPKQGGADHINEQWQSWWGTFFKKYGFGPARKQPDIRNNSQLELWYRQNIILYERGSKGKVEDFVLPEYYMQIVVHFHAMLHHLTTYSNGSKENPMRVSESFLIDNVSPSYRFWLSEL